MRKLLLSAAMIALVATSCNRDKDLLKATVVDSGDIALDGCGYLLDVEGEDKLLKPSNLPTAYMHDGYKVKVKYDANGGGVQCIKYPKFDFIEVIQLTKIKVDLD